MNGRSGEAVHYQRDDLEGRVWAEHVNKGLLRAGGIHASPEYGSLEPTLQFPALQRMAAIYGFSKTFRICLGLEWGFG